MVLVIVLVCLFFVEMQNVLMRQIFHGRNFFSLDSEIRHEYKDNRYGKNQFLTLSIDR
jgi:hypothetical protein